MKKRFVLMIGAMKSGTTSLFRWLGAHPQVLPSEVKEPKFFTDDRKWALGFDWYRSLWDFREPDPRLALEASTDYAKHPVVPCPAQRVAQSPAGFRFLYVLRDPCERIESHAAHAWREGWSEQLLADGVLPHWIDTSRYAMQLDHWLEHFDREDFLLLRFEDLVRDPQAVLRSCCRFLEIDAGVAWEGLSTVHNATPGRPAAGSRRPRWARIPGLSRLWRPRPAAGEERFRLSPEQRAFVLRELRDDLDKLERDWKVDTSAWRRRD